MVQSHVPDAVKNSRTFTVQNILFKFIQNTVMYKNVHNIFHSVYILKKDNCNFKYFLLTCHVNIVLGPFSLLKLYPLLEIFMTGDAFRWRIRSTETISQATHLTVIGWITGLRAK